MSRADKPLTTLSQKRERNLFLPNLTLTWSLRKKSHLILLIMKLLIGLKKESNHHSNYMTKPNIGRKPYRIQLLAYVCSKIISINYLFGLMVIKHMCHLKFLMKYVIKWLLSSILEKTLWQAMILRERFSFERSK